MLHLLSLLGSLFVIFLHERIMQGFGKDLEGDAFDTGSWSVKQSFFRDFSVLPAIGIKLVGIACNEPFHFGDNRIDGAFRQIRFFLFIKGRFPCVGRGGP